MGYDSFTEANPPVAVMDRSIEFGAKVTELFTADPDRAIAWANHRLDFYFGQMQPRDTGNPAWWRWREILAQGPAAVLAVLADRTVEAYVLRCHHPFVQLFHPAPAAGEVAST
jgi:hypothetical protein